MIGDCSRPSTAACLEAGMRLGACCWQQAGCRITSSLDLHLRLGCRLHAGIGSIVTLSEDSSPKHTTQQSSIHVTVHQENDVPSRFGQSLRTFHALGGSLFRSIVLRAGPVTALHPVHLLTASCRCSHTRIRSCAICVSTRVRWAMSLKSWRKWNVTLSMTISFTCTPQGTQAVSPRNASHAKLPFLHCIPEGDWELSIASPG